MVGTTIASMMAIESIRMVFSAAATGPCGSKMFMNDRWRTPRLICKIPERKLGSNAGSTIRHRLPANHRHHDAVLSGAGIERIGRRSAGGRLGGTDAAAPSRPARPYRCVLDIGDVWRRHGSGGADLEINRPESLCAVIDRPSSRARCLSP